MEEPSQLSMVMPNGALGVAGAPKVNTSVKFRGSGYVISGAEENVSYMQNVNKWSPSLLGKV